MKKLNQSGALDALLVIAVGGFVMWRIGSADSATEVSKNEPSQEVISNDKSASNETSVSIEFESKYDTSNWETLVSGEGTFSMKIPDGWEVTSSNEIDRIRFLEVDYKPGEKVTWYEDLFGSDEFEALNFYVFTKEQHEENTPAVDSIFEDLDDIPFVNGVASKSQVTVHIYATEFSVVQRWISVDYEIELPDTNVMVFSYVLSPVDSDTYPFFSKEDQTDLMDSVISTIEII